MLHKGRDLRWRRDSTPPSLPPVLKQQLSQGHVHRSQSEGHRQEALSRPRPSSRHSVKMSAQLERGPEVRN